MIAYSRISWQGEMVHLADVPYQYARYGGYKTLCGRKVLARHNPGVSFAAGSESLCPKCSQQLSALQDKERAKDYVIRRRVLAKKRRIKNAS